MVDLRQNYVHDKKIKKRKGLFMGLIVKKVDKSFGTKKVVDDISFEIQKPGVYGLLGTNGARKNYYHSYDFRNFKKR